MNTDYSRNEKGKLVFMKKWGIFVAAVLALTLISGILLSGCSSESSVKLKVVTSTSLMEYIVKQVGGGHVEVTNLVPPSQHPGNFDVKPGDIQNLSSADLFLLHGWPGEGYADKLIISASNPNLKVVKVGVNGNWMIPTVQVAAADKVLSALIEVDSKHASAYQKAAEAYKKKIEAKETNIKNKLAQVNVAAVQVIASTRQADFLQWAGFQVAGTFANAQALSPQVIKELVDKGKAAGVILVINNLQDGKDAGKVIADELGVKNLNLSNFPGGFDDTETWEKAIDYNVDILLDGIKK
jgi:ABC-type Zn uptake system ZnuABC Zn-binding protein ZnuA